MFERKVLVSFVILMVILVGLVSSLPTHAQEPTEDSGQLSADSGQQSAISGQQSAVSEQQSADSGQPSADGGQQSADSDQLVSDQQPIEVTIEQPKDDLFSVPSIINIILTGILVVAVVALARSYPAQTKELLSELVGAGLNTLERQALKTESKVDDAAVWAAKSATGRALNVPLPSDIDESTALAAIQMVFDTILKNKANLPQ